MTAPIVVEDAAAVSADGASGSVDPLATDADELPLDPAPPVPTATTLYVQETPCPQLWVTVWGLPVMVSPVSDQFAELPQPAVVRQR